MKIGIVTWFGTGNFGTDLQCYAFCRYLQNIGHQPFIIQRFQYESVGFKYTVRRFLGKYKTLVKVWLLGTKTKRLRYNIVKEYKRNYLSIYPLVTTKHEYEKLLDDFDCFFSGSDQIWNPYHLSSFFLLDFASSKPRFAYASSLGVTDIPFNMHSAYERHLKLFKFIGVREETGAALINGILNEDKARQVLDPTFLLSKQEWIDFSKEIDLKGIKPQSFMLVYTIGRRKTYQQYVKRIQQHYGIQSIIVANSVEGLPYKDITLELSKISPMQFIYLLKNARLVCTDSFHATALCINMNLNFINLLRFDDSDSHSQNSRIYNILTHFNVTNRIYQGDVFPEEVINYDDANFILAEDREASTQFITNCLQSISKRN